MEEDISAILPVAEQSNSSITDEQSPVEEIEVYMSRFPNVYYGKSKSFII